MRLTLRTLLAYRDNVLNPADREDLHQRIQQSEFASNLLRRIEIVTRRTRSAPSPLGEGLGRDANTISEYIDDILPSESTPELERVCLETDQQLAELADCHHLLATALNTQVHISPAARARIVAGIDLEQREQLAVELRTRFRMLRKELTGDSGVTAKIVRMDPGNSRLAGPQLALRPDNLADEFSGEVNDRIVPGREVSTGQSSQTVDVLAPMLSSGGESIKPQGMSLEGEHLAREVPEYLKEHSRQLWVAPLAVLGLLIVLAGLTYIALGPQEKILALFRGDEGAPIQSKADESEADATPAHNDSQDQNSPADPELVDQVPAIDNEGEPINVRETDLLDNDPGDGSEMPLVIDSDTPSIDKSDLNSAVEPTVDTEVKSPELQLSWRPIDGFNAFATVLVAQADDWQYLSANQTALIPGRFLVGPGSVVELSVGGTKLDCFGPCIGEIGIDNGSCVLKTDFVQAVLKGDVGTSLKIDVAGARHTVELRGKDSAVSFQQSRRRLRFGPAQDDTYWQPYTIMIAVGGQALLSQETDASAPYRLAAGTGIAYPRGSVGQPFEVQTVPQWLRGSVRPIDRLACQTVSETLGEKDASLEDSLTQLLSDVRAEVRAQACQICLLLGDWRPFVKLLDDPDAAAHWRAAIELAWQMIGTTSSEASGLKEALRNAYGEDGELLFSLACGFPEDSLRGDEASRLVTRLESNRVLDRVLVFEQLRLITGQDLGYLAARPSKSATQSWKRELLSNRLTGQTVHQPIYEADSP